MPAERKKENKIHLWFQLWWKENDLEVKSSSIQVQFTPATRSIGLRNHSTSPSLRFLICKTSTIARTLTSHSDNDTFWQKHLRNITHMYLIHHQEILVFFFPTFCLNHYKHLEYFILIFILLFVCYDCQCISVVCILSSACHNCFITTDSPETSFSWLDNAPACRYIITDLLLVIYFTYIYIERILWIRPFFFHFGSFP